jgi:3'-phosphoadenosine 5'-phosphosulfate sulfotransferase (PAPS reductase)/FAD synthetase
MNFEIPISFLSDSKTTAANVVVQSYLGESVLADIYKSAYGKYRLSVNEVKIIAEKYIFVVACSFGKDSMVTLLVALKAHMELITEGVIPRDKPFVVCSIDTGVENHLVHMMVMRGCEQLRVFARENNINIDIRLGKPPISKQWSALFLSGLKLISASRLNNDCSVILKIDNAAAIERQIVADYGCDNVVTLLGSRLSESTKRAASIRKHGNDITADDLIEFDNNDKVFAPIVNWSDDDVWTILRRAGAEPISPAIAGFDNIFSFAKNHRFLHLVYSNSKDGSCPTSSKKVVGDKPSQGGCGGSARTGCYLCAKSIVDKSGEVQASLLRHSVISGNALKVRNYIMTVAQNIENRTWLAKAIDSTTGAIALQPNTLDAETIDKLLWLLSQVTHDESIRAENFKQLVAQGRELEDVGYADIINDSSMSDLDRDEMASAYREYAVVPLIAPMSLELALYISAIHSRDGVKLPPYRAFYVWNATQEGQRIPYPNVDPSSAVVDDIPDPIMVIPKVDMPEALPFTLGGVFDIESSTGCDADSVLNNEQVPVKVARFFVPEKEQYKLSGLKDSDTVCVAGLNKVELGRKLLMAPKQIAPVLRFSKRPIKRVSRKGGEYRVTLRGRTSQDKPSFGERSLVPNFVGKTSTPFFAYLPTTTREHGAAVAIDDDSNGYNINIESLVNWFDFEGADRAIDAHDNFVRSRALAGEHIYYFGGTTVIESLLRYGVVRASKNAKANFVRILQRTAYFVSLGLLSIDDASIKKLAKEKDVTTSIVSQFRNITASLDSNIAKVVDMTEFRSYKAHKLLELRRERNANRVQAKVEHAAFLADPVGYSVQEYTKIMRAMLPTYVAAVEDIEVFSALSKNKITFFDGVDIYNQWQTSVGIKAYLKALADDMSLVLPFFDKQIQQEFKGNPQHRLALVRAMQDISKSLLDIDARGKERLFLQVSTGAGGYRLWYLVQSSKGCMDTLLEQLQEKVVYVPVKSDFQRSFKLDDNILSMGNITW